MAKRQTKFAPIRGGFAAKPFHIFRADQYKQEPAPSSVLSNSAFRMLDNLFAQFNGINNGDLSASPKLMALYGWKSRSAIHSALVELLGLGFIEQTRQGGRNRCSLYAVTWLPIDECGLKLDVKATRGASNLWKQENASKRHWRSVEAHQKKGQEIKTSSLYMGKPSLHVVKS